MNALEGENNVNFAGNAAPHSTNNDFTGDVESQRPARRMSRKTLPLRKW
jgi:hypothetical protein